MDAKRLRYLLLPVIALILELLPYGAVCNFANPEGEPFRETYSYFDLLPFGYANFAPLLTALLTCVVTVLLVSFLFSGSPRIARVAKIVTVAAAILSLCPLLLGVRYYSVVGGGISLTLALEALWLYVGLGAGKHPRSDD